VKVLGGALGVDDVGLARGSLRAGSHMDGEVREGPSFIVLLFVHA